MPSPQNNLGDMDLALLAPSEKEDLSGSGIELLAAMRLQWGISWPQQCCRTALGLCAVRPGDQQQAGIALNTAEQGLICP